MSCIQSALGSAQAPGSPGPTEAYIPAEWGTSAMTAPSYEISFEASSLKTQRPRNAATQHLANLLVDECITSRRIPREQVEFHRLSCSGRYTEVYLGAYQGAKVAVKMLLPETRRSANHIEALLAEVKIMTSTDHPHILSLVGVAWDVLADICMVSEYMEGGDLRALLASYEDENHPLGFDRQKLTIAVHVAHALAYLHSFAPPVLHQNLKSTNILLSADLGAKISSFGLDVVEHIECTMTEDLRSHVWTAPEVLMGERYDASADIYSFGVVLSELDQHVIPHSSPNDELGQQPTDLAMKQNAILCKLQVRYASTASSIAALRSSCISLVPDDRPTAAEVLYNLRKMIHQLDEAVAGSW